MRKFSYISFLMFLFMAISSSVAWADDTLDTGNNAWMLTSSALVLLMTPVLHYFMVGCLL